MSDIYAAQNAWTAATELLISEGKLSASQIAFVRMAYPSSLSNTIFSISVGSEFVKNWIINNVQDAMVTQLSAILGREIELHISVDPSLTEQSPQQSLTQTSPEQPSPIIHTDFSTEAPHNFHDHDSSLREVPLPSSSSFSHAHESGHHYESSTHIYAPHAPADFQENNTETFAPQPLQEKPAHIQPVHEPPSTFHTLQDEARLNPKYTFDSFVIGESNRFAHATALAVAESPGSTYNPLFLYSDSGMGKTHLLHAIGNYTLTLFPNKKVLYVSSEEFTNWFINALRDQKVHTFKDQFRTVDVLLIDDIQFISHKDQTLDEFFHTFNSLSNANKQIVITSDVAPKLLTGFEERMISRFASGITASIDLPNLETRIAILDKKADAERMKVPREVIEYIGTHMTSNVREMEGALRRVTAYADLAHQPVSLAMAEMVLKDMISDPSALKITSSIIMAQTAAYFNISVESLTSSTRSRTITMPRHIAMYLCREMTDLSLPKIAESFHRRDHTTVIHAIHNIENKMAANQTIYNQVTELTTQIKRAASE